MSSRLTFLTALFLGCFTAASALGAGKKVLLVADKPSHGPGAHEYNAGMLLFQKCLAGIPGLDLGISLNDWPRDRDAFKDVDAIVIYCSGASRHPILSDDRLEVVGAAMSRGAGLGLLHFAVEPTLPRGHQEFIQWIGGSFEVNWSVNPHWEADFRSIPSHPVTRGVRPFRMLDEWYFHMRFADGMKGVTPLLVAVPPASTMDRPNGPYSGNATVRAAVARGDPQIVSWAFERPDGSRGFGYTGGHFHENWGDENARKLVLNAILWLAKMEVPAQGVASTVTPTELKANLDSKPPPKAKAAPKKS